MKAVLINTIKMTISITLLWFLTHTSKLNFNLFPALLQSPFLLLLTITIYLVVIALSTLRWQQLNAAQNIQLPYSPTLLPTYLGIAFNNLLPGGIGGDFFRFYFLNKKIAAKKTSVMMSILFDRITGLTGIFITVCLAAIFNLSLFSHQTSMLYFMLISLSLCVGIFILYLAACFLPQELGLSSWMNARFRNKQWLQSALSLLQAIRTYRSAKLIIAECLALSVLIQIFIGITCLWIAEMMQLPTLHFSHYIMAIAVTQIVNLIPLAPGGIGMGEIAFANILILLNPGLSSTYATVFLAYRVLGIFIYLPGVAVFLFDKNLLAKQSIFKENLETPEARLRNSS